MSKYLLSTIIVLIYLLNVIETDLGNQNCFLKSKKYNDQYLCSSYRQDNKKVFSCIINFIDNVKQIFWKLNFLKELNDTFYIQNLNSDDYLCSTKYHLNNCRNQKFKININYYLFIFYPKQTRNHAIICSNSLILTQCLSLDLNN